MASSTAPAKPVFPSPAGLKVGTNARLHMDVRMDGLHLEDHGRDVEKKSQIAKLKSFAEWREARRRRLGLEKGQQTHAPQGPNSNVSNSASEVPKIDFVCGLVAAI